MVCVPAGVRTAPQPTSGDDLGVTHSKETPLPPRLYLQTMCGGILSIGNQQLMRWFGWDRDSCVGGVVAKAVVGCERRMG